ncbi:RnfH family protein [Leeia oryzae]|uniref:RnfH family protein n=1 Tax=Leeia oryzae TaxID=356662 RepID=UPI00037B29EB|nr:RnfH family protein [Leeia oryzae]
MTTRPLEITVIYALPDRQWESIVQLPEGSTVAAAIHASGVVETNQLKAPVEASIFGKLAKPDHVLREGDRLEILRSLVGDPKEIRRRRVKAGETMGKQRQRQYE